MSKFRVVPLLDSNLLIVGWRIEEDWGESDNWVPLDEFYTKNYKAPLDAKSTAIAYARELKQLQNNENKIIEENTVYV